VFYKKTVKLFAGFWYRQILKQNEVNSNKNTPFSYKYERRRSR